MAFCSDFVLYWVQTRSTHWVRLSYLLNLNLEEWPHLPFFMPLWKYWIRSPVYKVPYTKLISAFSCCHLTSFSTCLPMSHIFLYTEICLWNLDSVQIQLLLSILGNCVVLHVASQPKHIVWGCCPSSEAKIDQRFRWWQPLPAVQSFSLASHVMVSIADPCLN